MASRPMLSPHAVITDGDMSADIVSEVTIIQNMTMISYAVSWDDGSTPVGSVIVQVSNDYSQNADGTERNSGTWTTVELDSTTDVMDDDGNGYINIPDMCAYAIRLIYLATSGGGIFQATIVGKVS